jgi:hypothetical protein
MLMIDGIVFDEIPVWQENYAWTDICDACGNATGYLDFFVGLYFISEKIVGEYRHQRVDRR